MAEVKKEPLGGGDLLVSNFADGARFVAAGVSLPVEKPIHEARSIEPDDTVMVHPTQLTIIFGSSFKVFDGVPAEKVDEIMRIAAAAAVKATETKNVTSISPSLKRALTFSSTSTVADLPIARRRSLQSFLEKRRDRFVNKNPYSVPASKTNKN